MKRLLIACSLITAPLLLASSSEPTNKTDANNKIKQETIMKMTKNEILPGLRYETLKEGSGISPQKGKLVTVHYTGWLDNNGTPGSKFDSSVDRNQPFTFRIDLGQVIQGWDKGVMSMKIGEKRRLFISSKLGYGSHGAGQVIPPNSNLIFDVELIKIT